MAFTVELFPSEPWPWAACHSTATAAIHAGRLLAYQRPFAAPALHYRVAPGGRLAGEPLVGLEGLRRRPIPDTLPFEADGIAEPFGVVPLAGAELRRLRRRSWLPVSLRLSGAVCSLCDRRAWQASFFHWFIDSLPRVLAAEDHHRRTGRPVRLLVPEEQRPWQRQSLAWLGWEGDRLIPLRPVTIHRSVAMDELIACCPRGAGRSPQAPGDAMVPAVIRTLRSRFQDAVPSEPGAERPRRLYISRADAPFRRVVNEEEVMAVLAPLGFERVQLAALSLREQILCFRSASHIVAAHGAGLTNLIHARQARVLEIFQPNHGLRPDFLQIAAILGFDYDYRLGQTVAAGSDIRIDPADLLSWSALPG